MYYIFNVLFYSKWDINMTDVKATNRYVFYK